MGLITRVNINKVKSVIAKHTTGHTKGIEHMVTS